MDIQKKKPRHPGYLSPAIIITTVIILLYLRVLERNIEEQAEDADID